MTHVNFTEPNTNKQYRKDIFNLSNLLAYIGYGISF